ncbi:hypothetical protein TNCV_4300721 [Trichonephila clavipes]|nr:hypothetical protein TNCV_4300721 [Trichonephila clavipes]
MLQYATAQEDRIHSKSLEPQTDLQQTTVFERKYGAIGDGHYNFELETTPGWDPTLPTSILLKCEDFFATHPV